MTKVWIQILAAATVLTGCSESALENVNSAMDLNRDGVPDIKYEFEEQYYYELVDRNFDTKVDESHEYGLDDLIVSSKIDADLDGILETSIEYQDGSTSRVLADSNGNGVSDIVTVFEFGEAVYAEKYYAAIGAEPARIGRVEFSFGYPSGAEVIRRIDMSEAEFADREL